MIDLLKNYKQLKNATGYMGSVRYYIAKKKLDTLFIKWLKSNKKNVQELLSKALDGKLKSSQQPIPFFSARMSPVTNLSNSSSINFGNTITPPRRIQMNQQSRRTSLNETYNPQLGMSSILGRSIQMPQQIRIDTEKIPQFYYPEGKPLEIHVQANIKQQINSFFGPNQSIQQNKCRQITQKVFMLPGYFAPLIIKKYGKTQKKIKKQQFLAFWKQFNAKGVHKRAFLLLAKDANTKFLTIQDFKQILKIIMDSHAGLQFLKSSPQFQDFYSICVINRMFYIANRKGDYKMTYRQFKSSNILKSFYDIQSQPEINANRDFFCYEDFYVIYIKFYQLDSNHKFLLNKEEFSKYSGYTLSRKTVQRIFSQTVKKFQSPQGMSFGDFVWFILSAQDKTSKQSIEYWFKILDLDNNGIVTGYQLQYFFQQQNQRLRDIQNSSTDFNYENIICQMVDLLRPKVSLQFTLQNFLSKSKQIGVFINSLTDLNKMLAYDQRDPYEDKAFKNDHPDWTDWDRFVKPQYKRVQAMDDNQDGEQVINWENDQ